MPRQRTGTVYEDKGKHYARITLAPGDRPAFLLPWCSSAADAEARRDVLVKVANRLETAGKLSEAPAVLANVARVEPGGLARMLRDVETLSKQKNPPPPAPVSAVASTAPTISELGQRWTSGELAAQYPDHVREKKTANRDGDYLRTRINPVVGDVPVDRFTIDDADRVMAKLPSELSSTTRRHVGQILRRMLQMAVFPMRLIAANPIPSGYLPKVAKAKAKSFLYPDEDARLLGCLRVPLCFRVLYGFLHREGTRISEATLMVWGHIDLERGGVSLDENKTDDPRAWALTPGTVVALRCWREHRKASGADVGASAPVFVDEEGQPIDPRGHRARCFRKHLKWAGVTRAELFVHNHARQRIRIHDTRATFVTLALASGKTEAWVQDRTGHSDSGQINTYRRAARRVSELRLGDLAPMNEAIPEFAGGVKGDGGSTPRGGGGAGRKGSRKGSDAARVRGCPTDQADLATLAPDRLECSTVARSADPLDCPWLSGEPGSRSLPFGAPADASTVSADASTAHLGERLRAAVEARDLGSARRLWAMVEALLERDGRG